LTDGFTGESALLSFKNGEKVIYDRKKPVLSDFHGPSASKSAGRIELDTFGLHKTVCQFFRHTPDAASLGGAAHESRNRRKLF